MHLCSIEHTRNILESVAIAGREEEQPSQLPLIARELAGRQEALTEAEQQFALEGE